MRVEVSSADDVSTIVVAGEVDVATCAELREVGEKEAAISARLRVDLSGVSFIDSSGIGALIAIRNAADGAGIPVVFVNPSAKVLNVLQITRLTDVFTIEQS